MSRTYVPPKGSLTAAVRDFCCQCMGWEPGSRKGGPNGFPAEEMARTCGAKMCPLWNARARAFAEQDKEGKG